MADQQAEAPRLGIGDSKSLTFTYASTVQFAPSPWDLKLLFGDTVLDLTSDQNVNKQHTGITLSWQQAKATLLFLHLNIDVYEREHGEIKIPKLAFSSAIQERISEPYITFDEALRAIREAIPGLSPSSEERK